MKKDKIKVSEIERLARERMKPEEIDHWESDLYLKVTPVSKELIDRYEYPLQVERFISNIEPHVPWYCIWWAHNKANDNKKGGEA